MSWAKYYEQPPSLFIIATMPVLAVIANLLPRDAASACDQSN
jgi:hypothetical protein